MKMPRGQYVTEQLPDSVEVGTLVDEARVLA
jgi:hypothetical protein